MISSRKTGLVRLCLQHLLTVLAVTATSTVANAGAGEFAPLGAITEEHFDSTFDLNVRGTPPIAETPRQRPFLTRPSSAPRMESTTSLRSATRISC